MNVKTHTHTWIRAPAIAIMYVYNLTFNLEMSTEFPLILSYLSQFLYWTFQSYRIRLVDYVLSSKRNTYPATRLSYWINIANTNYHVLQTSPP
jgi:hypothetical protein